MSSPGSRTHSVKTDEIFRHSNKKFRYLDKQSDCQIDCVDTYAYYLDNQIVYLRFYETKLSDSEFRYQTKPLKNQSNCLDTQVNI